MEHLRHSVDGGRFNNQYLGTYYRMCVIRHRISFIKNMVNDWKKCIQQIFMLSKFRSKQGMKKPAKYPPQNWLSLIHHFHFCFYWNYRMDKSDLFSISVI